MPDTVDVYFHADSQRWRVYWAGTIWYIGKTGKQAVAYGQTLAKARGAAIQIWQKGESPWKRKD